MKLSIIIPVLNEKENLPNLYASIQRTCKEIEGTTEIIFIDDSSTDGSLTKMESLAKSNSDVKIIVFRKNFGQSNAINAGIQNATGDIIVIMDADLQNDPADIPLLLTELNKGYDLVQGWRKNRKDLLFSRIIPSRIANWIIAKSTGLYLHDFGCALKVIRTDIAKEIDINGDAHRFLTLLAYWKGALCTEIIVQHHPRTAGKSKYGMERTFKVILDLIALKFIAKFTQNPMRLFGSYGLASIIIGISFGFISIAMKIMNGTDITGNAVTFLFILFVIIGVQFLFMGMLGELCSRIYNQKTNTKTYSIRKTINL